MASSETRLPPPSEMTLEQHTAFVKQKLLDSVSTLIQLYQLTDATDDKEYEVRTVIRGIEVMMIRHEELKKNQVQEGRRIASVMVIITRGWMGVERWQFQFDNFPEDFYISLSSLLLKHNSPQSGFDNVVMIRNLGSKNDPTTSVVWMSNLNENFQNLAEGQGMSFIFRHPIWISDTIEEDTILAFDQVYHPPIMQGTLTKLIVKL